MDILKDVDNSDKMVIHTHNLTKKYGDFVAVDNLNLDVKKGEVFGLLGPNGAGKTTTTLMLLGLTEPTGGRAKIAGFDCIRNSIKIKSIVGYLPDNVGFYGNMTGRENLRFMGRINGLDGDELEERINKLIERVNLVDAADKRTSTYSRGMRQRLGIADVLMKDPQIIIMDEPTLGIDPEGVRELMFLIRDLAEVDGRTILLSSHQLYQVQKVCDRMGIFVHGKMIACGSLEELGSQINTDGVNTTEISVYPDNIKAQSIIKDLDGVLEVQKDSDKYIIRSAYDIRRNLSSSLIKEGYTIMHLRQANSDLDEIYRKYFEKEAGNDESKRS